MKKGLLLINLGTPKSASIVDVLAFLRQFLTNKRVIDLPFLLRYALVYGLILPFRTRKSAKAYQAIWTPHGSPLLYHSLNLVQQLKKNAGKDYQIALGLEYGEPSLPQALASLRECSTISVLPLYPQYASAATGSALAAVFRLLGSHAYIPSLTIISNFYNHPAYIAALSELIKAHYNPKAYLLFSYHGIPERQAKDAGCNKICKKECPVNPQQISRCYRSQCYETSLLLANALQLPAAQYSTSFQSRLGKTPWIQPYTDEVLSQLAKQGIKHLSVCCPSFVTDCLETLEEIGLRAKQQWLALGGESFTLIPCLNDHPLWANAIVEIVSAQSLTA